MMTSSNGNVFRVTGHLCGEFVGPRTQRPVTLSFDVFFHLQPNKRFSKQWWGWWFETLSRPLWRHRNETLQWRHNGHDSVSNHQPRDCLLNCLFRRRSKKTSKLRVTDLCAGNSPGPVNSPHKWPVTWKMFPLDDVIMIREKLITEVTMHSHINYSCGSMWPVAYLMICWTMFL